MHEKRFYTLPHAAHGAIEDGLEVWEDVESITGRAIFHQKLPRQQAF